MKDSLSSLVEKLRKNASRPQRITGWSEVCLWRPYPSGSFLTTAGNRSTCQRSWKNSVKANYWWPVQMKLDLPIQGQRTWRNLCGCFFVGGWGRGSCPVRPSVVFVSFFTAWSCCCFYSLLGCKLLAGCIGGCLNLCCKRFIVSSMIKTGSLAPKTLKKIHHSLFSPYQQNLWYLILWNSSWNPIKLA